ncbi:hypothetical protein R1flu_000240 [Riccia fluitans]|uniref:Uncharacterized protein n=1 Tax=Riccia fluitans TaxID=41844 RepID=A0ABD1XZX3_9MARC
MDALPAPKSMMNATQRGDTAQFDIMEPRVPLSQTRNDEIPQARLYPESNSNDPNSIKAHGLEGGGQRLLSPSCIREPYIQEESLRECYLPVRESPRGLPIWIRSTVAYHSLPLSELGGKDRISSFPPSLPLCGFASGTPSSGSPMTSREWPTRHVRPTREKVLWELIPQEEFVRSADRQAKAAASPK